MPVATPAPLLARVGKTPIRHARQRPARRRGRPAAVLLVQVTEPAAAAVDGREAVRVRVVHDVAVRRARRTAPQAAVVVQQRAGGHGRRGAGGPQAGPGRAAAELLGAGPDLDVAGDGAHAGRRVVLGLHLAEAVRVDAAGLVALELDAVVVELLRGQGGLGGAALALLVAGEGAEDGEAERRGRGARADAGFGARGEVVELLGDAAVVAVGVRGDGIGRGGVLFCSEEGGENEG